MHTGKQVQAWLELHLKLSFSSTGYQRKTMLKVK